MATWKALTLREGGHRMYVNLDLVRFVTGEGTDGAYLYFGDENDESNPPMEVEQTAEEVVGKKPRSKKRG
jgi:hypothetical protein